MKIRRGFVSNSSSSSFVCDVCGGEYSGMNASLEDAEMVQCKNGHIVCIDHLIFDDYNTKEVLEYAKRCLDESDEMYVKCHEKRNEIQRCLDDNLDDIANYLYDFIVRGCENKSMVHLFCPLCRFTDVSTTEATQYLLKSNDTTISKLKDDILQSFETYEQFNNFINRK